MAKWENCIAYGLLADRPAPGARGALYGASDTGTIWRDNGTSWDELGVSARHQTIIADADIVLDRANVTVFVVAADVSITLPDPALNIGLEVLVKDVQATPPTGPTGSHSVKNPDGTEANGHDRDAWRGYSTGAYWWWTDS